MFETQKEARAGREVAEVEDERERLKRWAGEVSVGVRFLFNCSGKPLGGFSVVRNVLRAVGGE